MDEQFRIERNILYKANKPIKGVVHVPDGVTVIADDAFKYKDAITKVVLPESVTSIGKNAFYGCSALKWINVPAAVKKIGDSAFYLCDKLKSIELNDGLQTIGDWAFYSCTKLSDICLPSSVQTIGESAFCACLSLRTVKLGASVESIGKNVFARCEALETIELDGGNAHFVLDGGVLYDIDRTRLLCVPTKIKGDLKISGTVGCITSNEFGVRSDVTSVELGEGITMLEEGAFAHCMGLKNIVLPDGLNDIRPRAFYDCRSLTSVFIPKSVDRIMNDAFGGCENIEIYCEGEPTPSWEEREEERHTTVYTAEDEAFNFHRSSGSWNGRDVIEHIKISWNPLHRPVHTYVTREQYAALAKK